MDYASVVWSPHLNVDITIIGHVQQALSKRILCLKNLSYEIRFKKFGLISLEQRRKYIDLVWLYKIIHGLSSITMPNLCITVDSGNYVLRNKGYRLYLKKYNSSAESVGFTYKSVQIWNSPPTKFYTTSLSVFKRNVIKFFSDQPNIA